MIKKKYVILSCIVLAGITIGFFLAKKQASSIIPPSGSLTYTAPPNFPPLPAGKAVPIPTHGYDERSAQKIPAIQPTDQILKDRAGELDMMKKMNSENNKRIFAQMKAEEIASLKNSIVNDEILLKKIEQQGTGIGDYKFIKENLEKRRKRLQTLSNERSTTN